VWKSQKNAQNQRQNSVQSHECQSHSVCIIKTQRKADALQMPVRDLVLQCEMCFDQRWHWRWPNANERTRHRVRESSGGVIDLQQNIGDMASESNHDLLHILLFVHCISVHRQLDRKLFAGYHFNRKKSSLTQELQSHA